MGFLRFADRLRDRHAARRFVPTSVVAAVAYLGVHRIFNLLYMLLFSERQLCSFWQAPFLGGLAMIAWVETINVVFIAYVSVDFFVSFRGRRARSKVHFCSYCAALIVLGGYQLVFHRLRQATDHLQVAIARDDELHPTLTIRHGEPMDAATGRPLAYGQTRTNVRIRVVPGSKEARYTFFRFAGEGDELRIMRLSTESPEQLLHELRRRTAQDGTGDLYIHTAFGGDIQWQHVVYASQQAFAAGLRRVILTGVFLRSVRIDGGRKLKGSRYFAEVVPTGLSAAATHDERASEARTPLLVQVWCEGEEPHALGAPAGVDPNSPGYGRAMWYEIDWRPFDPSDAERLSEFLAQHAAKRRVVGSTEFSIGIRAATYTEYEDIVPIIAAATPRRLVGATGRR
jgi:hypothetical protein